MIKAVFAVAAIAASALFLAASGSSAPPPANVMCSQVTQAFSGTAHDLTVPANGYCAIEDATITHNLIVQHDSGGDVTDSTIGNDLRYSNNSGGQIFESTIGHDLTVEPGRESSLQIAASRIGHDVIAHHPDTVQTGGINASDVGPVQVGNDFVIDGSPGPPDPTAFVFDGIGDLSVGHDLRITNRWVTLGIGLGNGPVTVGRDLVFSGNQALTSLFLGPSGFGIGDVTVGRDLTVTRNSATAAIAVGNNTVARNATCRDNSPAAVSFTGPNSVGGKNNGCP